MFEVFFDGAHASHAVLAVDVPSLTQAIGSADLSQSIFQDILAFSGDGPHPNPPPKILSTMAMPGDGPHPNPPPKLFAALTTTTTEVSTASMQFTTLVFPGDVPHPNPPPKLSSIIWQGDIASSSTTYPFSAMIFPGDFPYPPDPPRPQ